jgi:hypothetical protein
MQERYDEKWNLSVVPKVIEEELNCKVDEENARKKLVEAAQREAGAALEAEGQRLQQVDASMPCCLVMLVCTVLWLGWQLWMHILYANIYPTCHTYLAWRREVCCMPSAMTDGYILSAGVCQPAESYSGR